MALIRCSECGQMVSDRANVCPKCGSPMYDESTQYGNVGGRTVYRNEGNGGNKNNGLLYAVIALLVAALVGGGYYFYDKNKQMENNLAEQQRLQHIADSTRKAEEEAKKMVEEDAKNNADEDKKQTGQAKTVSTPPKYYGQVQDKDGYTNIRRGPSTNDPIVRQYNSGDYLYYTPLSNGWSMVYSGDKASTFMGYMHSSRIVQVNTNSSVGYLSPSSSSAPSGGYHRGHLIDPKDTYVNVRKGPGTNYPIVIPLDTYTNIYYTKTGSNWYKVYDTRYNYLGYVYYDRIKNDD